MAGVAVVTVSVVALVAYAPDAEASAPSTSAASGVETPALAATSALATSLLSPRRLPDWLISTAADQKLATSVAGVLTPAALGPAAASTCAVVAQNGRVLDSVDPGAALIPASNMKILTATAALDDLGPDFRYTTRVVATSAPVGGVLTGDLYLVGSGDPLLRTPGYVAAQPYAEPLYTSFDQLAAQVRAAGITQITGSVVGDESLYDTQRAVPTWKADYTEEGDVGPLSALDVDDGFQLTGSRYEASPQPAVSAATQFAALLSAAGVRISGPPGAATTPAGAVPVTSIQSAPLSQIVQTILTVSDDTGAELLTKELGARFGGGGTTTAGVAVIRADLSKDGLPLGGFTAADGSGLDRLDRLSCRLIAADLAREGPASVLAAGLPVAGRTGTLEDRLSAPSTVGRIEAKTGTLSDVSALSGFVLPAAAAVGPAPGLNRPLVFSLIMNGLGDDAAGIAVADDLATTLAAFPAVPNATSVEPEAAPKQATGTPSATGSASTPTATTTATDVGGGA